MEGVMFYIFGGVALVSAGFVVMQRRPVHSALFLILTFFCLAGLFLLLRAEFIAAVQVIVYAGAIMVLFLFVIMLLNLEKEDALIRKEGDHKGVQRKRDWIAIFVGLVIFILLIPVWTCHFLTGLRGEFPPQKVEEMGNTVVVAKELFTRYLLPFEIASILLLVAMIGAVILSKRRI
jgi:NADH-quinone oxidoreductase subunit J